MVMAALAVPLVAQAVAPLAGELLGAVSQAFSGAQNSASPMQSNPFAQITQLAQQPNPALQSIPHAGEMLGL